MKASLLEVVGDSNFVPLGLIGWRSFTAPAQPQFFDIDPSLH